MITARTLYEVNGVRTSKPLKPHRLSHIGLFYNDFAETLKFYRDILGLSVTDIGARAHLGGADVENFIFVRAGSEHHCVSLFPNEMRLSHDDPRMQHAAWELQTYSELLEAVRFLTHKNFKPEFVARRLPGGNYAVYFLDPEGNRIELLYGLDVIGWQGRARPRELWGRFLIEGRLPDPPIKTVEEEIDEVWQEFQGFNTSKCTYTMEKAMTIAPSAYETVYHTSGERRKQPFKISRIRYYALGCSDLKIQASFYEEIMGLRAVGQGERGELLFSPKFRNDPQLKLFPFDKKVDYSKLVRVCFEVRTYSELLGASEFLKSSGIQITYEGKGESTELHNEYCIDFSDPSGNPIRLSFSPDANGLVETAESKAKGKVASGLPSWIECE